MRIKAFIFDLDGVLTETQHLHADAWKKMFNEFFADRNSLPHGPQENLSEFDVGVDYRPYLDGKPRPVGIRSLLKARRIELSEQEILRLSDIKNTYYQKALKEEGPQLIPDSVSFLQKLKEKGMPMAVVSSSRNCRTVLEMAGLTHYFQVVVDPTQLEGRNLEGKPAPDYFIEASRKLGLSPQDCAIVEDSLAGIESGKRGEFQKVYGINIYHDEDALKKLKLQGADQVISSLWDITEAKFLLKLPNALEDFTDIFPQKGKDYFIFLDFDGTLSPIVSEPGDAQPLEGIIPIVKACAEKYPVCIITGRDTEFIKKLIDIPEVYYITCHGFEISGPGDYHYQIKEAVELIPVISEAQKTLTSALGRISGLVIERKKFGLAFHYRMIQSDEDIAFMSNTLTDYLLNHPRLRLMEGEKVFELLPRLNWDKGKALMKLYEVLKLDCNLFPALYFGDGKTDENAFREMKEWGVPILASVEERPTLARYHLSGPPEVKAFLKRVTESNHV